MNRKAQIINELSEISIHLQYMPTFIDTREEHDEYFSYFEKAIALRKELKQIVDGEGI